MKAFYFERRPFTGIRVVGAGWNDSPSSSARRSPASFWLWLSRLGALLVAPMSSPTISPIRSEVRMAPSACRSLLIGFWAGLPSVNGLSCPFPEESSTRPEVFGLLLRASSMNGSTNMSGSVSDSEGSAADLGLGIGAGGTESIVAGLFSRTLEGSIAGGGIRPPPGNELPFGSMPFGSSRDLLIASSVCGTSGGVGGSSPSFDAAPNPVEVGTCDVVVGGGINLGATDPLVDSVASLSCSKTAATSGGTEGLPSFGCWVATGFAESVLDPAADFS